jgi:hypothetical protein
MTTKAALIFFAMAAAANVASDYVFRDPVVETAGGPR